MKNKLDLPLFYLITILLCSPILTACAGAPPVGDVLSVQPNVVIEGLNNAFKVGGYETIMMLSKTEDVLMVGWKNCSGWCWIMMDGVTKQPLRWSDLFGNYTAPKTMRDLVNFAYENGWTRVLDVRDLRLTPFAYKVAEASQTYRLAVLEWLQMCNTAIPVFSLTPLESFDIFNRVLPYKPTSEDL